MPVSGRFPGCDEAHGVSMQGAAVSSPPRLRKGSGQRPWPRGTEQTLKSFPKGRSQNPAPPQGAGALSPEIPIKADPDGEHSGPI